MHETTSLRRAVGAILLGTSLLSHSAMGQTPATLPSPGVGGGGTPGLFGDLHRMLPVDSSWAESLAVGDVDGDLDPDVLVGTWTQNRLYLNDGDGVFREVTATHLPEQSDYTASVVLGDVDGDGDLDALIGNGGAPGLSLDAPDQLLLNDGTGAFSDVSTTHLPALAAPTSDLALGDVNGDGYADLVISNNDDNDHNRLYLNDGNGVFSDASAQLPGDSDETYAVVLEDVDGDGDRDLVTGNSDTQNRLYLNDGAGVFTDATGTHMPVDADETFDVAIEDVDGDGDCDVLTGNRFGQNRLYLNDGTGVFSSAPGQLNSAAYHTTAVALEDLDGDGDRDALIVSSAQDRLYLNDGTGSFIEATELLPADDKTYGLAVMDVDADGDPDLLMGNRGQNRLHLNNGTGVFSGTSPVQLPEDGDSTWALVSGDLDGDGDPDLVLGNYGYDRLYLNDGAGLYSEASWKLPDDDGTTTSALALGDVDGDGDPDLVQGHTDFSQNLLSLNDGKGTFTDVTPTHLPAFPDVTEALAMDDVDGDGDLDLVFGNKQYCDSYFGCQGGQDRLYLNDGNGVFTDATATHMPLDEDTAQAVSLGDVDGDGDPDLYIGNGDALDRLYLNDGAGVFSDVTATQLPALQGDTSAVALGDVDGDLDLDLVTAAGGTVRLALNDGSGSFTDATGQLPDGAVGGLDVLLGDMDGDGDRDLLTAIHGGQNSLYLNDGSGLFSDATAELPADDDYTHALVLEDVDADGDPDVVIANSQGQNRLYSNLTRQLAWRRVPAVGKALTMNLYGAPGAPWRLFVFATGPRLGSGSGSAFITASYGGSTAGFLDAEGRSMLELGIPNDPALVGTTWVWRARIGSQPSNVESTTFTNL